MMYDIIVLSKYSPFEVYYYLISILYCYDKNVYLKNYKFQIK